MFYIVLGGSRRVTGPFNTYPERNRMMRHATGGTLLIFHFMAEEARLGLQISNYTP